MLGAVEWAAVVCLLLIYAIYRYSVSRFDHFAEQGIPFKKPSPFVGNLGPCVFGNKSYVATVTEIYDENRVQRSPFYGVFNLRSPSLYVRDPKQVVNVLKTDFKHFPDRGIYADPELDPLSGNLFMLDGEDWKNLRHRLLPVFAGENLRAMAPLVRDVTSAKMEELSSECKQNGGRTVLNAIDYFKDYALEVIATCAFGLDSDAYVSLRYDFSRHVAQVFKTSGLRGIGQFIRYFQPSLAKFLGVRFIPRDTEEFFVGVVQRELDKRRKFPEKGRKDFLQLLMDLQPKPTKDQPRPKALTDIEIAAQAFSFIVAGFDTISTTLAYLFYDLARHSEVQGRVRREATDCLKSYGDVYEAVMGMTYLDMAVKESLRVHPAIGGVMRHCRSEYHFSDGGPRIKPENPIVVVPIQGIQGDPEFHKDPEEFTPERFAEDGYPAPGTYLPFGEGQRNCIGKRFAMLEMKLVACHVIKDFEVTVDSKTLEPLELDSSSLINKAKGGIWLQFTKI